MSCSPTPRPGRAAGSWPTNALRLGRASVDRRTLAEVLDRRLHALWDPPAAAEAAQAAYRRRLAELDAELEAADRAGDDQRAARGDVTRTLRATIDKTALAAPGCAAHLRASVHTGRACRYQPPGRPQPLARLRVRIVPSRVTPPSDTKHWRRSMWTDEHTLEIRTGRRPLVDEPVGLVVADARPGSAVAVRATVEVTGAVHQAMATFDADEAGLVDTARQASLAGSYTGVDPFGLWWSGQPVGPTSRPPSAPLTARVQATTADGTAEAVLQRHWLAPGRP
jgi:Acyl-CoA thioester hydrolase/BAAT N-terminal region